MIGVNRKSFRLVLFIIIYRATAQETSDIVGKITVGYQGWFATAVDGSPRRSWVHWSINGNNPPQPGNCKFELYPDVREYLQLYQTGLASLGNGQPANLFSSFDPSTVNKHGEWMQKYDLDTISFQRFGSDLQFPQARQQMNQVAVNVERMARAYGRKVFLQYDLSNWANFSNELIPDLTTDMAIFTSSTAYAHHNGKKVICLWGIGFGEPGTNRPNNPSGSLTVISRLQSMDFTVMCGVPHTWRTNDGISRPTYQPVYAACNMIQPWSVGTFNNTDGAAGYQAREQADLQLCNSRNQVYQPVVWPGFAWSNWMTGTRNAFPRHNGQFMWRQFVNLKQLAITSPFIAMFDEYDEGTAIAKAAENSTMIPQNQYFLTLDADSQSLSSDFYLRCTQAGRKLMLGQITGPLTSPYTPPIELRPAPANSPSNPPAESPANVPSNPPSNPNVFVRFTDMMANMTPSGLMSMLRDILVVMGL